MRLLLQALSISTLVILASCAHHHPGSCSGDKAQCEMHKNKQECNCKDNEQCPMKKEEAKK